MSKSEERFARQYPFEPPPEFPLASPCSLIVHRLSGLNGSTLTQIDHHEESRSVDGAVRAPRHGTSHLRAPNAPLLSLRVLGFARPCPRRNVELLGPCFQTGRLEPLRLRLGELGAEAPAEALSVVATSLAAMLPAGAHKGLP